MFRDDFLYTEDCFDDLNVEQVSAHCAGLTVWQMLHALPTLQELAVRVDPCLLWLAC